MSMEKSSMEQIYAEKWQASSKFFMDNGYYKYMAEIIKPYKTVIEIGCGVGYSTVSLINDGHKVIAVEKNHECFRRAKDFVWENGCASQVTFLVGDIIDEAFRKSIIAEQKADVVICWNPGILLDNASLQYYMPFMLEYGLTSMQIKENPATSYTEMMLWHACKLAKAMCVPIHIIDRCIKVDDKTVAYYHILGRDTGFSNIQLGEIDAETISDGGVPLLTQGVLLNNQRVSVVLVSVLFT